MRVSTASTYLTTSTGLGGALSRVQDVQSKLASGKQINTWSDNAPDAASAETYRAQEADWSSFTRSQGDAQGFLDTTDGTLQSMSSILNRVKELAVSAVNGGLSDAGRTAAADEITQLRKELTDLGQTQHLGRSVFGGFQDTALASNADGTIDFAGDGGVVKRQVSPTVVLDVNVDGKALFGFDSSGKSNGTDVFSTLSKLADAARDGDTTGLTALQGELTTNQSAVGMALSKVGATVNQITTAKDAGSVATQDLAARRSQLEDVDLAEAVLKLNAAQAGYTAALGAASKANLPSLADYLK